MKNPKFLINGIETSNTYGLNSAHKYQYVGLHIKPINQEAKDWAEKRIKETNEKYKRKTS